MIAFAGFERLTKNVSSNSVMVSPMTWTVTVFVVWPASKTTVPVLER
jgi:hypothetical protein